MTSQANASAADAGREDSTVSEEEASNNSLRTANWIKWGSLAVAAVSLILLVRALPAGQAVNAVSDWVDQLGALAPFAFVGVYFLATVLMLPASLLSIAAGILFGLLQGTLVVLAGATCGMAATFLIGRYLARETVETKIRKYPRAAAIDRAVGEGGWKIVALLRLSPVVPFNLQNYLYGITAIRFWPCIAASAVAIIPGTFMYVYLGYAGRVSLAEVGTGEAERGMGQWVLIGAGLIATIIVTIYITRMARKALREQTAVDETESAREQDEVKASGAASASWLQAGAAAIVAVLLASGAAVAQFQPSLITNLFGTPAVVMQETYEVKEKGPSFDHGSLDKLLKQYVNDAGGVDYAGLNEDAETLHAYNTALADAPFDELGRNEKLALLINAYNSFTIELILEWLDRDIESIKEIPASKRWTDERWNVGGNTWSLNQIEHEQIRPKFREPNIHWAVVCAAVGCPPLRREAYTGERIEQQLRDQAQIVHTDGSRWFRHDEDAGVVHLTRLYDWYGGDFEQVAGSVLDYAAKYSDSLAKALEDGEKPGIQWMEYNWALNSQENLQ